jgi:hypothetical protein
MKRLAGVAVAVGALLVALVGSPAWAKEPGAASLSGPGLSPPIRFSFGGDGGPGTGSGSAAGSGTSGEFFRLVELSGYWSQSKSDERPSGALGARYDLSITWGTASDPMGTGTLVMYPFAQPKPVTFVPDHALSPATVGPTTGWYLASPILLSFLQHYGMPVTPPAPGGVPAAPNAPAPQPVPDAARLPWGLFAAGMGLAAAVALVARYVLPRRRVRVAA